MDLHQTAVSSCRNTPRVRLYQKLDEEIAEIEQIIAVAILHEYDYIKRVPLESLAWQGLPAQHRRLMRKSVMPKDKVLIVLILFICILHNLNDLYKIEGLFVRATGLNLLIHNTIRHFCLYFRTIKKRGFDVFSLTVIFKTRYENHSIPPSSLPQKYKGFWHKQKLLFHNLLQKQLQLLRYFNPSR